MNKKGFTLIELLAVLIVLSIILLIAVPRILDAVDVSRKKAFEISANKLIQEASKEFAKDNLEKEYIITNGTFESNKLDVKGDMPKEGSIFISEDGKSSIAVHDYKYCAKKLSRDDKIVVTNYEGYCGLTTPVTCFTYTKTETEVTITGYDNSCTKDAIIPDKIDGLLVTSIGSSAFSYIYLTSVTIPSSVKSIGSSAFLNNQLTSVVIPSSVTSIGSSAFAHNQLTNITIPNSLKTIEYMTFLNNQLTTVTIPSSVTIIDHYAFFENKLTSAIIPSSVTSIGDYAFYNNQLTSLNISPSAVNIKQMAFNNNQLPDSQAFIYARKSDGSEDKTTILSYGGSKRNNVVIPSSVTTIENYAFSSNELTSVIIPNSVTTIKEKAFANNKLTNINIPSSVKSIENGPFNNNQLPDNQAFIYARKSDGSEDKTTIVSYGGTKRNNVVIPSSVTSIGAYAFDYNQLTSVVIPSSVTSIGNYAFYHNQLTSVVVPNSVINIALGAFYINNLISVNIPSNITINNYSVSPTFYTSYVTVNGSAGGTYTAPSQSGTWTKQ